MDSRTSTSISSLKALRNVAPDKSMAGSGPIQLEEASEIFDKIDMNADKLITHAELARSMFHSPEIAERLHRSGDPVLQQLAAKGRGREIQAPEYEFFNKEDLQDLLCYSNARNAKSKQFVQAYGLDQGPSGDVYGSARAVDTSYASQRVSAAMESLLVNEDRHAPQPLYVQSQGLVQSNHELTRRLQACLVKSERDDARILSLEEALAKERTARGELESQMRVELTLALEVLKGKHLAVVQNMQAQQGEELDRLTAQQDTALRELREHQAEELSLAKEEAQSREAGLRGQIEELEGQRADLQRRLAEMEAKYEAAREKSETVDQRLREMREEIHDLGEEKLKVEDALSDMTARAEQLQKDKEALEAQGLSLDQNLNAYQRREQELKARVADIEARDVQLRAENGDLLELVREHERAHDVKDKTVRQSIAIGKQAIEERHDLARRQVAAWTELEVQRSICRANNGILGMDALDAIRKELGQTVGDPDVPVSVASVTGEKTIESLDFDRLDPLLEENAVAPPKLTARERRLQAAAEAKASGPPGREADDDGMQGLRRFGQFKVSKKGASSSSEMKPASHRGP